MTRLFSLFISSSCVIWVFIILSFILQRDAAGNQTASDGFADVDKPPKQTTHLIRKGFYEKLDGTLSWIDAVSMIIPMLERGGGGGKEEAKVACGPSKGPALPILYEFYFSSSLLLFNKAVEWFHLGQEGGKRYIQR